MAGIGSAFIAGSNVDHERATYLPLLNYISSTRPRGGGGGGIPRIGTGLSERMNDPAEKARWSRENQIRMENAGRLPMAQDQAGGIAAGRSFQRQPAPASDDMTNLQFHEMIAKDKQAEFNRGIDTREQTRKETETGLDVAKDKREADVHKLGMDMERRLMDHQEMMKAFTLKDPLAVTTWFVKHAPKDAEGAQRIPFFSIDEQTGKWMVEWPGGKGAEPMDDQALGRILQSLSPKYERPKSDKEYAEMEGAKMGGGISLKDMEKLRQDHARYMSEGSELSESPLTYQDAYQQVGGGLFSQGQAGPTEQDMKQAYFQLRQQGYTKEQAAQELQKLMSQGN